jgi:DNA-binding protein H-NS
VETSGWRSLSIDELWKLHKEIAAKLVEAIEAERAILDERLRKIKSAHNLSALNREQRSDPKELPKYQNPENHAETWSGRGRRPRWLRDQLRAGKGLDDFAIRR